MHPCALLRTSYRFIGYKGRWTNYTSRYSPPRCPSSQGRGEEVVAPETLRILGVNLFVFENEILSKDRYVFHHKLHTLFDTLCCLLLKYLRRYATLAPARLVKYNPVGTGSPMAAKRALFFFEGSSSSSMEYLVTKSAVIVLIS